MLSTMQDSPLTIPHILRHGTGPCGATELTTWTADGPRRTDYAALGRRAARLAHGLRELGVEQDTRVATLMWNNAEHMETYFAIPSTGAVLHTLNIRLHPDEIGRVANHAEDHVIIADGSLVPLLRSVLPELKTVRHVLVTGAAADSLEAPQGVHVHDYEAVLSGQPDSYRWPELDERTAAAMCYTSGTTGEPKGVVYSHRSITLHSMQACMSDATAMGPGDRSLAIVPMFHALSWGLPYAALLVGASLIMPDRFLQPDALVTMIETERPTLAAAVPTIWTGVLQQLDDRGGDISSLREVLVGGAACPEALMRAFEERYGVHVLQGWGMTETSPLGSIARAPAGTTGEQHWSYRASQGRFPANVRARLVDADGAELPWDGRSVGELEVSGPWVTGGYYHLPGSAAFDDGWLRTGDVGHISPDGYLRLTDRAKDVIKSGGEWISSVQLENAAMGHPAVAEAVVVGVPDAQWSERPLVVVALREGERTSAAELRAFLAERLPRWQVPEYWTFMSETPKTSVGKFDKKRLRQQHADGQLDVTRLASGAAGRAVQPDK
ncbi:long-chain fatty acid--CoA ligase [Bounagaea algeriensis]